MTGAVAFSVGEFVASDGFRLQLHRSDPTGMGGPKLVLSLAHGMGEHAGRYGWFADRLAAAGVAVRALDLRGHGPRALKDDALGDLGPRGWERSVEDLRELSQFIREEYPRTPLVLFGHSMGSFLVRQLLVRGAEGLDGAVLSGTTESHFFELRAARWLARIESWRVGRRGTSRPLERLLFGSYNRAFDPDPSGFEWLSRDAEQVRRYVEDPLCGFVLRAGSLADMFEGLLSERRRGERRRIPRDLPVYVFSGERDPLHREQRGFRRLLDGYRAAGLTRVSERIYPGGRHEMLNETNRDEVCRDLIEWLAGIRPGGST